MPGRPYLIDNRAADTTHAAALSTLFDDVGTRDRPLSVATGYVNLGGLHHLAAAVGEGTQVRLLLGAAPAPGLEADLPMAHFERALATLSAERDLARFPPSRAAAQLTAVDDWLSRDNVDVRRFVMQFLHGKAYLFGTPEDGRAALVTSANLTAAGLFRNLELGLVHYDPGPSDAALRWFDELWKESAEYKAELRALLFPDPGLIDPRTVYLRALLELYGDELDADVPTEQAATLQLAPFQRDGYERARRILARHHGVIYADGVGTGKTEIGLAFIEEYALRRGHHALVVAPAQLVDLWQKRIHQARLPAQVISFQQLASDEQLAPLAPHARRYLFNDRDSYRLIVVDEGHALRNPDTTWHRAMERLLGGQRKDLVLLTATPVNNGLWDLYHLVLVFARHDRAFAAQGIPSVRQLFIQAGANERDPENLDTDILFPLADSVSVRRDRRFIEEHYPDATFPDGTRVRFPTPESETRRYDLDELNPGLFSEITGLIGSLTMARYRPSAYAIGAEEDPAQSSLSGLLQSGVLKRFESCWWACLQTVRRMVTAHDTFLQAWDSGFVPSPATLRAAAAAESDEAGLADLVAELLADDPGAQPTSQFRPEYRDAVVHDRELLVRISDQLNTMGASSDPKLRLLRNLLDESTAQKIAVFASFGDTIRYLDDNLTESVGGRSRVTVIGTESDPDTRSRLLGRFCPDTVVHEGYRPPDGEVDLLLSTDVLSEGQNLQQAAAVISYDMPWNPQRVVQRNGRVIRLKSPHTSVGLTTMLPTPGELETFLKLEATIRRKVLAASIYGLETEVLDGVETELRNFAARLADGDPALLDPEDGPAGAAFAGEALRAELLRAVSEGELQRLQALPWGTGAVFRQGEGIPSTGRPGIFFACRTRSGERYWRYVESESGSTTGAEVSEADMLRRINPGGAPQADAALDLEGAWRIVVASIVEEHNQRADPRTATQAIGPVQRFALGLLRDPAVRVPPGASAADEALSVERSSTVRQALAEIRSALDNEEIGRDEAARRIVEAVQAFGLQPVEPPPSMEPITEDDVGVVCWIGVLPESHAG